MTHRISPPPTHIRPSRISVQSLAPTDRKGKRTCCELSENLLELFKREPKILQAPAALKSSLAPAPPYLMSPAPSSAGTGKRSQRNSPCNNSAYPRSSRGLQGGEGIGEGKRSSGVPPAEMLKIGGEGWRLPLKAELHLIPASHDGALLSRSRKSHCKHITFQLHIWGWVA